MPEVPVMPQRISESAGMEEAAQAIQEATRPGTDWGTILAPIAQTIAGEPALLYRLFGMEAPGAQTQPLQIESGAPVSESRDQVRQWANMVRLAPSEMVKQQLQQKTEDLLTAVMEMEAETLKGRVETVLAQATDHDLQILQGLAAILKGDHGSD